MHDLPLLRPQVLHRMSLNANSFSLHSSTGVPEGDSFDFSAYLETTQLIQLRLLTCFLDLVVNELHTNKNCECKA